MAKYKVLVPCKSDKHGKSYQIDDIISHTAFPAGVIKNWLEIGVLEELEETKKTEETE